MLLFLFFGMVTGRRTPDSHSHLGIPTAGGSAVFKVTLGIKIQQERRWWRRNPSARVMYICTLSPLCPATHPGDQDPAREEMVGKEPISPSEVHMYPLPTLPCHASLSRTSHTGPPRHEGNREMQSPGQAASCLQLHTSEEAHAFLWSLSHVCINSLFLKSELRNRAWPPHLSKR